MKPYSIDRIRQDALVAPAALPQDLDIDDLVLQARRARARYLGDLIARGWRNLRKRWRRAVERRNAYAALVEMSDYELSDIGLSRSDIKVAVYGPPRPKFQALRKLAAELKRRYGEWRRRRQAYLDLEQLDDHILRDIGITRQSLGAASLSAPSDRAVALNVNEPLSAA